MSELKKIAPSTYLFPKKGGMLVDGLLIANEELLEEMEIDHPLEQVANVAHLPGIVGYSIAMPDIHWGYGCPIGGVAAMDAVEGVISPGGVGYDINCGVRLALIPEKFAAISEKARGEFLKALFRTIPSGVGQGRRTERALSDADYRKVLEEGARWSIEKGDGYPEDLEHMESYGCIEGARLDAVSQEARNRGRQQLGSIGSGNHFVEIGAVERVFSLELANSWGVEEGQTYVLIHSGSRGFGHQVCQDALDLFLKRGFHKALPDRQLVAAPLQSEEGQSYFRAMAAAANFAFNNRQQILARVRDAAWEVLQIDRRHVRLLYDVCHNIAKFEEHVIEGRKRRLCVHRKGA